MKSSVDPLIISPHSTKLIGGYTGITLSVCPSVRPSVCPSVRLSVCGQNRVRSVSSRILIGSISYLHILSSNFRRCVCPSVRLSICGQNRVRSVSSRILIGSISYLHILSSNFRRCVACNAHFKIQKFEILAIFFNLLLWLCLLLTWDPIWLNGTVESRYLARR